MNISSNLTKDMDMEPMRILSNNFLLSALRSVFKYGFLPWVIHFCFVSVLYRQALANALAAAPSMWTLGNAGMGALQVPLFS